MQAAPFWHGVPSQSGASDTSGAGAGSGGGWFAGSGSGSGGGSNGSTVAASSQVYPSAQSAFGSHWKSTRKDTKTHTTKDSGNTCLAEATCLSNEEVETQLKGLSVFDLKVRREGAAGAVDALLADRTGHLGAVVFVTFAC